MKDQCESTSPETGARCSKASWREHTEHHNLATGERWTDDDELAALDAHVAKRRQERAKEDAQTLDRLERWLAKEEVAAKALPLGTTIDGGPLNGAPAFDVRMRTVRLIRALLDGEEP